MQQAVRQTSCESDGRKALWETERIRIVFALSQLSQIDIDCKYTLEYNDNDRPLIEKGAFLTQRAIARYLMVRKWVNKQICTAEKGIKK